MIVQSPPQHYTFAQLEQLWVNAGGPKNVAPIMAAIALAESSGNPAATGHNSNGTVDRGLWQINSVHGYAPASSYTPIANARQAVAIYRTQGLNAWTVYRSGAYKTHLAKAGGGGGWWSGVAGAVEGAAGAVAGGAETGAGAVASTAATVAGGVEGFFHDVTDVPHAIEAAVASATTWAESAALRALAYIVLTVVAILLFDQGLKRALGFDTSPLGHVRNAAAGAAGSAAVAGTAAAEVPF